jgi:hypothetical protein
VSGKTARESRRRAIELARQKESQRKRREKIIRWGGAILVLAGAGAGIGIAVSNSGKNAPAAISAADTAPISSLGKLTPAPNPGPNGPENVPVPNAPLLSSAAPATAGQKIDGVGCLGNEQLAFHIHTHLTIFDNGQQQQVPGGIGIPGSKPVNGFYGGQGSGATCFYFLHSHAADGIIHIESPVQETFTLGQFFDEWGQPLSTTQVGPDHGKVTVLLNGKVFKGNPRNAPLGSHEDLQLDVGNTLIAPETINWGSTGL